MRGLASRCGIAYADSARIARVGNANRRNCSMAGAACAALDRRCSRLTPDRKSSLQDDAIPNYRSSRHSRLAGGPGFTGGRAVGGVGRKAAAGAGSARFGSAVTLQCEPVRECRALALAAGKTDAASTYLTALRETEQEWIRDMRMLIFQLHPPLMVTKGLVAARWEFSPRMTRWLVNDATLENLHQ